MTADAVGTFAQNYERAYKYNAMLAGFVSEGTCVDYLELYVVGDETTITERTRGFDVAVTTRGSYTGTACETDTGTDTPTPPPHVDLPNMTARLTISDWALEREQTVHECW